MIIKLLNTLGITRPWLVSAILIIVALTSGLFIYGIQHARMNVIREVNKQLEISTVVELSKMRETNLKQLKEMEKKLKSTTVTVEKIMPDGSRTTEVREDIDLTENIVVKTEVIEVVKEVIKEVEVIREVEVINEIITAHKPFALGVSLQPKIEDASVGLGSIGITGSVVSNGLILSPYVNYNIDSDKPFLDNFEIGISISIRF